MRSGRTPPFIRPDPRSFALSSWRIINGRQFQDGDLLPEWDPSFTLTCVRVIEVELPLLVSSGRLRPGARVAFIPTWWSEGTSLRGRGVPEVVEVSNELARRKLDLALTVAGLEVSRMVQLKTSLVLESPCSDMIRDSLAPKRPGSILWEDTVTLVLEGNAPRFPISVVDFVDSGLGPASSCWRFEWSPQDISAPALSCMRLYINSRQKVFHDAIVSTNPTPSQKAIRSALKHAIGKELVALALEHSRDLEVLAHHEVGSCGRVLCDLLNRVFPGRTPTDCVECMKVDPGVFSAQLQAAMGIFSETELQSDIV
jgi:hypothetical protein